jgi:hypothetical protein
MANLVITVSRPTLKLGTAGPQGAPGPPGSAGAITLPCDPSVLPGDLVAYVGNELVLADPTDLSRLPCIGCIASKLDPVTAILQTSGIVPVAYSGLSPSAACYVGQDSRPTSIAPAPSSGESVVIQAIGLALDATTLLVSLGLSPLCRIHG